jgi:hypothetical protein
MVLLQWLDRRLHCVSHCKVDQAANTSTRAVLELLRSKNAHPLNACKAGSGSAATIRSKESAAPVG